VILHRALLDLLGLAVAALRLGMFGLIERLATSLLALAAAMLEAVGVRYGVRQP
jgi:hypothetical protein